MSLPCGCDPSLEGGYGDDGRSSRYSMEWCPLHAKAPEMREFIRKLVVWATHADRGGQVDWTGTVYNARALLAELT